MKFIFAREETDNLTLTLPQVKSIISSEKKKRDKYHMSIMYHQPAFVLKEAKLHRKIKSAIPPEKNKGRLINFPVNQC